MKKLLIILLSSVTLTSIAQKKIKFETVFFEDKTFESANLKINVTGGFSEFDVIKAKLKVFNYSNKTIVIKPEECYFTTHQGNIFSKDKWIVVAPRDNESKVIDIKADNIKTDSTSLHLNGVYICNEQTVFETKAMPLPPEKELSFGNFRLEFDGWDRDGKEIMIRYKVRYVGDKIGMMVPSKVTLKSPDGGDYKNQKDKEKVHLFRKNEDIIVGFVFVSDSKKDNTLLWNDAFSESVPEKTDNITIELKMDLIKTKDKN